MLSSFKNVLCKTCLILIVGFTLLITSYAHAQTQTAEIPVDGDNGSANPPGLGDDWEGKRCQVSLILEIRLKLKKRWITFSG